MWGRFVCAFMVLLFVQERAAAGVCVRGGVAAREHRSRFVAISDSVHDQRSGLTWARCSVGQRWNGRDGCTGAPQKWDFAEAKRHVPEGWRMPTKAELLTLVVKDRGSPAVDVALFPDTPPDWFWTASREGSGCWSVDFRDGTTYFQMNGLCEARFALRPVRDGRAGDRVADGGQPRPRAPSSCMGAR
jgi:hypothetical protein